MNYTSDQLCEMLETGAADSRFQRAAIHLLTFTGLVGRADLAAHIETATVPLGDRDVPAAWIRDWTALGRLDKLGYLSGGEERFIRLAASMAHGDPVDLRAALSSLGHAHARRVLEAAAICLEANKYYTITPTSALAEMQRREDEMLAGELRRRGLDSTGQPIRTTDNGGTK